MRISDWSSDVCSSDLPRRHADTRTERKLHDDVVMEMVVPAVHVVPEPFHQLCRDSHIPVAQARVVLCHNALLSPDVRRSEEHTSELQSLMRSSYAVFCLKKKTMKNIIKNHTRCKNI